MSFIKQANPFQFFNQKINERQPKQKLKKKFTNKQFIFRDDKQAQKLKKQMIDYQRQNYVNKQKWKFSYLENSLIQTKVKFAFLSNIQSAPIRQMNIQIYQQRWSYFWINRRPKNILTYAKQDYQEYHFLKAIQNINFVNLKVMKIKGKNLQLQCFQLLLAPNLTHLQIGNDNVLNLKFIKKSTFKNLQHLRLQSSSLNLKYDNMLQILKIDSKVIERIIFNANWTIYQQKNVTSMYHHTNRTYFQSKLIEMIFSKLIQKNTPTHIRSLCYKHFNSKQQQMTVDILLQEQKYRDLLKNLRERGNRVQYYF